MTFKSEGRTVNRLLGNPSINPVFITVVIDFRASFKSPLGVVRMEVLRKEQNFRLEVEVVNKSLTTGTRKISQLFLFATGMIAHPV